MRTIRGFIRLAGLSAAGLLGLIGVASAQVHDADVGINQGYQQTSDSTADLLQADFSARAFYNGATDYTAPGTLTIPGGSTRSLNDQGYGTPELGYQETFINGASSLTDAQAVYQTGSYDFDLPAGDKPEAKYSINYTGNAFPNVGLVTNLSALQGLNPADNATFNLNGLTTSPNATDSLIFFYIYNATTQRWSSARAHCQTPLLVLLFPAELWLRAKAIISTCFTAIES